MPILQYIKNFFVRSVQGASTPHVPAPPNAASQPTGAGQGVQPIERHYERHTIAGTPIELGFQEQALLDQTGQLVQGREFLYIRLGCGHLVSRLDTSGPAAGVGVAIGGTCPFCQSELAPSFEKGQIPLVEFETLSMFCANCAAPCDGCGRRNICCRHSLAVPAPDGRTVRLCPACREASGRKQLVNKILSIAIGPFVEPESQGPEGTSHE
jgi:hypothetical protein